MRFRVDVDREEDGRWLAEVPELPGVLAYGASAAEAQAKVQALALRVVEPPPARMRNLPAWIQKH